MVTDTAAKLKNVKAILESFQPDALDNAAVVKSLALAHELEIARENTEPIDRKLTSKQHDSGG